jgi:hypothetical protein
VNQVEKEEYSLYENNNEAIELGKIYKELAAAGRARCDMPSVPTKMCQVLFSWGLKIVHAFFNR